MWGRISPEGEGIATPAPMGEGKKNRKPIWLCYGTHPIIFGKRWSCLGDSFRTGSES